MINLILPYPPSTNRYWRMDRRSGHLYPSEEAKVFKKQVKLVAGVAMANQFALRGPLAVTIRLYRPQASGDLDNFLKQPLDALQGVVYENDKQIIRLLAERFDDGINPRCEVDIEQLGPVDQALFAVNQLGDAIKAPLRRARRRLK